MGKLGFRTWGWTVSVSLMGHVAVGVISALALRLLTGLAPPAVFGAANLTLTLLALVNTAFAGPFTNTQIRFHSEAVRAGREEGFTRDVTLWSLVAAAASLALGAPLYLGVQLLRGAAIDAALAWACVGWTLATTVRNVFVSRVHAEARQKLFVAILVAEAVLLTLLTAGALMLSVSAAAYVAGQAAGTALVPMVVAWLAPWRVLDVLRVRGGDPAFLKRVWSYGAPFTPMAAFGWVSNLADRYVVGALLGTAAAGRYVAPFAIASRGMALPNAVLVDLLRPALFDSVSAGDERRARRLFWGWVGGRLLVAAAALGFVLLFGDLLARIFLAAPYRPGARTIMLWIVGAYAIYGVTQTLEMRLMAEHRTRQLILPPLAGAVANIGFSLALVPRLGIVGAAQATCLSFALQLAATGTILWLPRRTATADASAV